MYKINKKSIILEDVTSMALPCPFCGERPKVGQSYMPTEIDIRCVNENCHSRPYVYESVQCKENKGDIKTFTPMFELHYESILDKWNTRY